MAFRYRTLAVALTLAAAIACNDSPSGISDSMVGTYNLVTVNGQAVPVTLTLPTGSIEVVSGRVEVKGDGTCRYTVQLRSGAGNITQDNDCTWTRSGSAAFFTLDDGNLIPATVSEGTLSFTYFGAAFVLQR